MTTYFFHAEELGQPRHHYLALTRSAALALIDGRLQEAEQLIDQAAALGERICDPWQRMAATDDASDGHSRASAAMEDRNFEGLCRLARSHLRVRSRVACPDR